MGFRAISEGVATGPWRGLPDEGDDVAGIYFLAGGIGEAIKNRSPKGGPDATVVGNPTETEHGLILKGGVNYLLLNMDDPAEFEFVVIGRLIGTVNAVFLGSSGTGGRGANIYTSFDNQRIYLNMYARPAGSTGGFSNRNPYNQVDDVTKMRLLIGDGGVPPDGVNAMGLADMTGVGEGEGADYQPADIPANQERAPGAPMSIGGRGSGYPGECEILAAIVRRRRTPGPAYRDHLAANLRLAFANTGVSF